MLADVSGSRDKWAKGQKTTGQTDRWKIKKKLLHFQNDRA